MESLSILSYAEIPVVWSVYGGRILSDDEKTIELLHRMAQKTNNRDEDLLNSLTLIEAARHSDGALADIMASICIKDLINKTETIIYIFENFGPDKLEPYFLLISFELTICDEFRSDSKYFNDFVSTLRKRDLDYDELNTLEKIIEAIKMKYDLYKDK